MEIGSSDIKIKKSKFLQKYKTTPYIKERN